MNQIRQRPSKVDSPSPSVEDPDRLWTLDELSSRYGVHIGTVRRWGREGRLRTIQIGRFKRVRDQDRDQFESRKPARQP